MCSSDLPKNKRAKNTKFSKGTKRNKTCHPLLSKSWNLRICNENEKITIAIKLRRQGKSYSKISKELGVPKSTLSDWFSDIDWSKSIKADLTKKANYIARKRLRAYNKKQKIFWEAWREQAR